MQLIVGACQRLQKHRPTGAVGVPAPVFRPRTDAFHPHAHTQAASITHHVVVAKEPHPFSFNMKGFPWAIFPVGYACGL